MNAVIAAVAAHIVSCLSNSHPEGTEINGRLSQEMRNGAGNLCKHTGTSGMVTQTLWLQLGKVLELYPYYSESSTIVTSPIARLAQEF